MTTSYGNNGRGPTMAFAGAPPAEAILRARDLTMVFNGTTTALDEVDLDLRVRELCVLVGLSGSGKSTLLRHANGLQRPTSGSIEVFGIDPSVAKRRELRELRTRVGFIFQHFGLVGRLTALGNVLAGGLGRIRGPRYDVSSYPQAMRREAREQLDRVGLADQAFQRADTLSGGQQQRVAIARTVFQRAELVLADEPVASLDPETSEQVMEILFSICEEDGLTVLCSLHQVDLALGWADRMVGMRDGRIVLDQPAAELTADQAMQVYNRGTAPRRASRRATAVAEAVPAVTEDVPAETA